jgi:predicted metalloprotease with PDZ domain
MRRDAGHVMAVKKNNGDRWSLDDVMLLLWRRQNGDMIKW